VASSASNSGATTSSTGGIQFDFPDESLSDLECADIKIVEYATPTAVACRTDVASASTTTTAPTNGEVGVSVDDTSGTGLDRPASTIVEADIVDCAGNIIDVTNLTVPISFLVPLANNALLAPSTIVSVCVGDSFYLPNGGDVVAKTVVIEKEVECSFFDETTQQWSSDGCVVADNNVTQADGSRAVRCECTHLTEFAILLREKNRDDATSCNLNPASVFGSIVFLVFACLFSLLLAVAARQTYYTIWAFGLYQQKTMLTQHTLVCLICIFRIVVCVIYYELQHASVRADVEFKAVAAISGLPYIFMLWLFSLLVTNWASIYYAAKRNDLAGVGNAFQKWRPHFIAGNVVGTFVFGSLFVMLALSTDAKVRASVTLAGSSIYAIVVFSMSIAFAFFGYGLLVQLSKDFKSSSAQKICKVGMVFCACFVGEACIWLMSGVSPDAFFANFEAVNSVFFSLDIIALVCILLVTKKSLHMAVADKRGAPFKPGKMTARRSTVGATNVSKKGSTGSTGGGSRVGSPPMSPAAQRNQGFKSRRGTIVASRLTLSKQSKRRKMAAKLSALKLPVVAVVDPDDPLYDGVAVRAPLSPSPPRSTPDVEAFTSKNEFGETVIDVSGFERQRAASIGSSNSFKFSVSSSEHSIVDESEALPNPIGEFEHWFEALSVSSSLSPTPPLSSVEPQEVNDDHDNLAFLDSRVASLSSVETQEPNDGHDNLNFLDGYDNLAFLDSPPVSDDTSEISDGESSFDFSAWHVVKETSLSLLSSLSSWSWSQEDEAHSSSSESDEDVELDAFLDAAKGWI
jgi:hypothetical protein